MKKWLIPVMAAALICVMCAGAAAETITMSFIGDCTVGEQYRHRNYKASFTTQMAEKGLDYPFSLAVDLFAADDVTIANCEGSFTNRRPYYAEKFMSLSAPPEYADVFKLGKVDVCNITNNHDTDFGRSGRLDTYENLMNRGIGAFGVDWTYMMEIKGVKIGFVGQSYPINDQKLRKYSEQMAMLRELGCTFIVASIHWGTEESYKLNGQQLNSGHKLIDMGADIVYGHGPHVLQPIELYQDHLIFYSTANFTFGANSNPKDPDTAIFQVTFDVQEDGTLALNYLKTIPYCMHKDKDYRPWPYTEKTDQQRVWGKLWREAKPTSNLPESFLKTGSVDFTKLDIANAAK